MRAWSIIVSVGFVGSAALGCSAEAPEDVTEAEGVIAVQGEAATTCAPLFRTWEDPTVYPATANAYLRPGFFHAMSYASDQPTATPAARIGEACSFIAGRFHVQTRIKSNCSTMPDGSTSCIGLCIP